EDYVPFEEEVVAVEPEIEDGAAVEDEVVEDENTEKDAVVEQESEEAIEADEEEALEKLVQGAGVAADYFVFEKKEQPAEDPEEASSDIVPAKEEIDAEKISLYNDELMPYSFRWWLHKTRLEHADTYQPFATPVLPRPQ